MELEFTFRNIESTEAIKEWARGRFRKVVKHLPDATYAHLTLAVDKHRHRAEVTVHARGEVLRVSDETDDMYTTLDAVMDKLQTAAQRHKERGQEVR